ncbi:MAG: GIY-YIG nuclease family protein [Maribacter sp.]|nr:GIY-YIG nuclease family protein [Maribacter sp.]
MKLYYVYILQCSDGLTYTGMTNNISRRIEEHQRGLNKSCFTYKRRPIKLVFHQEFNDVEQAIFFEKRIKNWSGKKKLALANGDLDLLKLLAQCRNETHARNSDQEVGLDSARPDITITNDKIL